MDPVTAFANLATALIKFATVSAEGQTADQRALIWSLVIKDMLWWRRLLKIDDGAESKAS